MLYLLLKLQVSATFMISLSTNDVVYITFIINILTLMFKFGVISRQVSVRHHSQCLAKEIKKEYDLVDQFELW